MAFVFCLVVVILIAPPSALAEAPAPAYQVQLDQYCGLEANRTKHCHMRPGDELQRSSEIVLINSCQKNLADNQCALQGEARMAKDDLFDCRPDHLCDGQIGKQTLSCTIDGVKSSLTFATAAGIAGDFAAGASGGLLATMPFLAYHANEIARSCDANLPFKRALIQLHNMALSATEHPLLLDNQPGDGQGANASLLKQDCVELRKFLDQRLNVFVQRRMEAQAADPEGKAPPLTANQRLLQSLNSNACFKQDVLLRKVCETITSVAAGAALGAGSRLAARRTMDHLDDLEAQAAGKVSGKYVSFVEKESSTGDHGLYNVKAKDLVAGGKALAQRFADARPANVTPEAYTKMFTNLLDEANKANSMLTILNLPDGTIKIFIDELPAAMVGKALTGQQETPEGQRVQLDRTEIKFVPGKDVQIAGASAYAVEAGDQLVVGSSIASMSHRSFLSASQGPAGDVKINTGATAPSTFTGGAYPEFTKTLERAQQVAKALWPKGEPVRVQSADPKNSDQNWYFKGKNGRWTVGLPPGASREAYEDWAKAAEKPEIPYFAMGRPDKLSTFVKKIGRKEGDVRSTEPDAKQVKNADADRKYEDTIVAPHKGDLPGQIEAIAHDFPKSKALLMDLTGVDLNEFRGYLVTGGNTDNVTHVELKTILQSPDVFKHTRFFKDGVELSYEQIYFTFEHDNPRLFH